MGKGKGLDINLEFILRVIALVLVIVAIALLMTSDSSLVAYRSSLSEAVTAQNISASIYIIILLVLLGLLLIKDKQLDETFSGVLMVIGALLLIGSGIAVAALAGHDRAPTELLVSGIMAAVGGVALLVDALKSFGVF